MLKLRFSRLLVTLPLLAMPLGVMGAIPAKAAGAAAEEAVRILNRARGADQQCSYLSSAEKNELSRYTARAEIAAASQASPSVAKAATAAGMKEGRSTSCTKDVEADVRETLEAAREAVAASDAESAKPEKVSTKPVKRVAAMAGDDEEENSDDRVNLKRGNLGHYARVVHAYYLERECRSLSRRDADRFWNGVVRLHKSVLRTNGKSAVARVMASAERRASGSSCGKNAEAKIRQGYELALSR